MWKRTSSKFLIFLSCLISYISGLSLFDTLVETQVGLIRGLRASDGDYSMFMGIPYATVDKNNPFGAAIPNTGFDDVFEAYDDSAICPQIEEFNNTLVGTLDCLHINVYVPDSANTVNSLPVLVYIYGGGYSIGFAGRYLYGPKYFMKQDVILVTFNYRLGPYGFMCLDTPEVPGNEGFKDQQIALKWIKNNIEAFGGNSNQITIFGNSAGASSVDFQLMYSQEKLFNQVIMQSGTTMASWAVSGQDTLAPLKLAEALGVSTTDVNEALYFLSTVDPLLIIATTTELGLAFSPCIEQEFENVDRFIHDHPMNIQEPNLGNMPVLLGFNSDEALAMFEFIPSELYDFLNNFFVDTIKSFFDFSEEDLIKMSAVVRHFFIGDNKISIDVRKSLEHFYGDLFFTYPTIRTIQKYLDIGNNEIYYYVFSYYSERNFVKNRINITSPGVAHADEISFLFDVSYMNEPTPEDQLIIDRVTSLWANFAKFGNPTPVTSELLPIIWPAVTKDSQYYLNIDSDLKVGKRIFKERFAFWDLFYLRNKEFEIRNKNDKKAGSLNLLHKT